MNTKKSADKRTQDFLPRFTCLPVSQSSLWRFTHLKVHELIGITHQTLNRVPHNQHKMRIIQATSNPLEYLLALRWGKGQEPLTITTIKARDNHQSPLNDPCCSKQSRWRQLPRVTSESHSETRIPSASRCKHSRQCTQILSQSHKDDESMMEMSGRCLLMLTRMLGMSKC